MGDRLGLRGRDNWDRVGQGRGVSRRKETREGPALAPTWPKLVGVKRGIEVEVLMFSGFWGVFFGCASGLAGS